MYWSINSIKVYQLLARSAPTSSSLLSSVTPLGRTSSISAVPVGMGRTSTNSSGSPQTSPSGSDHLPTSTYAYSSKFLEALPSTLPTTSNFPNSSTNSSSVREKVPTNSTVLTTLSSRTYTAASSAGPDTFASTKIRVIELTSSPTAPDATAEKNMESKHHTEYSSYDHSANSEFTAVTISLCRTRPHRQQQPAPLPLGP